MFYSLVTMIIYSIIAFVIFKMYWLNYTLLYINISEKSVIYFILSTVLLIIIHDLMTHLNLLEKVIYPLQNSNLYTLHGIQYITVNSIKNIVTNNLVVKDVLYTVLSRRNITVINNNDGHI